MAQSPAFHEFVVHALGEGPQTVCVDVDQCTYLDSTFLGSLLDLHRKYGTGESPRFRVFAGEESRRKLFSATHLHKVFRFVEGLPEPIAAWVDLCPGPLPSKSEMARHVMECHRRLAEIDGPAQKTFALIADRLERELTTNPQG